MRNIGITEDDQVNGWHQSIRDQEPDHPDSLIKQIQAMRVDVSHMSTEQLNSHMIKQRELSKRLSKLRGFQEILPPTEDYFHNKMPAATRDVTDVARGHL